MAAHHRDVAEHLGPFVGGMDEPEACKRPERLAHALFGGAAALQRDEETHAEEGQSIEEVDNDQTQNCHALAFNRLLPMTLRLRSRRMVPRTVPDAAFTKMRLTALLRKP